jgi:preprotein translocase subunit SecA
MLSILTTQSEMYTFLRMINKVLETFFGSQHEKDLNALLPLLKKVNAKEAWAIGLEENEFPEQTVRMKEEFKNGKTLDELMPEAFALVREAARRTLGERLYDVQILGGIVLHQGKIMEMKTGEGKTVSSVSAAYLNALAEKGVHIVTVNDYLASRDAAWMGPVYRYLGISVGVIFAQMDNEARRDAYKQDITYGTNNEFGFDYLRDNMRLDPSQKVQQFHHYCIIDEIDSILIDEARTPLIISGAADDNTKKFIDVNNLIGTLNECERDPATGEYPEHPEGDYKKEEKSKKISFTDEGLNHIEKILLNRKLISDSLFVDENIEYIHYFTQALRAHTLFHKDTDYVVQDGLVQIVDEFTGRILHGRRYSDGLHQAIEAKERIRVAERNRTLATITFQNFFRMYEKISGMTGTADTEAKEFAKIYSLNVVVIPTNRPVVRNDEDDVIFLDENQKFDAICTEIEHINKIGQPILVGTVSIDKSEHLASLLTKRGIRHEVLNAKNHAREALIIAEAGAKKSVTIATNMAGRGTDIKLGGNPDYRARRRAGTEATQQELSAALEIETKEWRNQYDEVCSIGGLYILGTERHESRRIDNQLRGRSGRQGDPGCSKFFLSMDDDLMRLFGGGKSTIKSLLGRVGMADGQPLNHPLINKTIERAQNKVEERNFEIRKHLLEYDDVLNEQRKFMYERRDEILTDNKLLERVINTAEEIVADAGEEFFTSSKTDGDGLALLLGTLKENIFYQSAQTVDSLQSLKPVEIQEIIIEELHSDLRLKASNFGEENLNMAVRLEYVRHIDRKWQDHLENLEALREAVYLRTYGQKNPLLEYKLEGFQIFDQMLYDIRTEIAKKLLIVKADGFKRQTAVRRDVAGATASHGSINMFQSGSASNQVAPAQAAANPEKIQVKRSYPKVGRNDPCPCGSGKKYKYCHGNQ